DDVGERALVAAINDLKQRGTTVFLITHRMNILQVVDKLLVMREGSVAMYGPRQQVLTALQQQQAPAVKKSNPNALN
ncbi:MAG TPA: type I secretion system permease/ATPase, partial [Alcaligenaceae bacterium]|nr:type I secretion system permease/ATPase [Alcaligenaceae bacterium]